MDEAQHIIEMTRSGWHIEHPKVCRQRRRNCGVARWGVGVTLGERRYGRFLVDIAEDGKMSLGAPLPSFPKT